jgi:hypothetical protein
LLYEAELFGLLALDDGVAMWHQADQFHALQFRPRLFCVSANFSKSPPTAVLLFG